MSAESGDRKLRAICRRKTGTGAGRRGADEGIELLIHAFCEPGKRRHPLLPANVRHVQRQRRNHWRRVPHSADAGQLATGLTGHFRQAGRRKSGLCLQPQQPDRATDQSTGFSHSAGVSCGKAIVVADEAYIDFCPQASLAGWLAEYPHLAIYAHCRKLLLWRGFVADLRWQTKKSSTC